jgi:hypothetical protein
LTEAGNLYSTITIDGTYFSSYEPAPFSKEWFSHKFKGPGVRYELAISIRGGNIVHIHGPFPAKCPDIEIFRDCVMPPRGIAFRRTVLEPLIFMLLRKRGKSRG